MAASFTRRVLIERAPEVVFAYASDTARLPEWMPEVESLQRLDDGPLRVGSRFRETRRVLGKSVTAEVRIVTHDGPPERSAPPFTHAGRTELLGVEATYTVSCHAEAGGRTRVELLVEARATSFAAKLLLGKALKAIEGSDGQPLERLKRAVERDAPATTGETSP